MKCFYHSADLDGHCSGAIVKHRYPECELIGINYGQPFPWESIISPAETVFMVDFSLQPFEEMMDLRDRCTLVWIDHHKSAIEEADKVLASWPNRFPVFSGVREIGKAGCELTWNFLFPHDEAPPVVWLLGRYDVWDLEYPSVLAFQYGMRLFDTNPENQDFWGRYFKCEDAMTDPVVGTMARGKVVMDYVGQENAKYAKACAFEVAFEGLRCIAINKMLTNSQVFDTVWDRDKYHAMITFGFRHGKWTFSMYSDREDVDVSEICKRYGGGGHKGASGFQCDHIPFQLGGE